MSLSCSSETCTILALIDAGTPLPQDTIERMKINCPNCKSNDNPARQVIRQMLENNLIQRGISSAAQRVNKLETTDSSSS